MTSVVDAPRLVSSDASPTRPECAVIRRSTPAAAAAAVHSRVPNQVESFHHWMNPRSVPVELGTQESSGCLREWAKSYGKGLHVERGRAPGHRYSPVRLMCSHPKRRDVGQEFGRDVEASVPAAAGGRSGVLNRRTSYGTTTPLCHVFMYPLQHGVKLYALALPEQSPAGPRARTAY